MDRNTIASLSVLVGVLLFRRDLIVSRPPLRGAEWLVIAMIAGGFITALTNDDVRRTGAIVLPGMPLWAGVSRAADAVLIFGLPFYLGRLFYRQPRDLHILLLVLAGAGALYSIPILWEARMSPHLHFRLYGYQPAEFAMAKRELWFGWRPMVFVGHGLSLAMFMVSALLAAVGLWRARSRILGRATSALPAYLFAIVLLCNSLGAMVYAAAASMLAAFTRFRLQLAVLMVLAGLIVAYPSLRAADWFPTRTLVGAAASFSQARADSLAFRFENEDLLLEHARKRLWFGWGGYGRDRVFDPETGREESTSDGYWIIAFGQMGLVGFACAFGLLLLPVVRAAALGQRLPVSSETALVTALAWIVALNSLDLLPNGFLQSRSVFLAGALAGAASGWRGAARTRGSVRRRRVASASAPRSAPASALSGLAASRPPGRRRSRPSPEPPPSG